MRKKALRKEFYMEIRKTWNRFLSILLITALGVAFFSGIRATQPDMQLSADRYYDESRLMDLSVQGTLGLTDEDVESIAAIEGVSEVMPFYSMDLFGEVQGEQLNLQVMAVPEAMNLLEVTQGRLPETDNECVVDKQLIETGSCRIGDTVSLSSGTDTAIEDILEVTEFTIVGAVTSPYYLSLERGTTSIGNGTLNGFLAIPESAFALDYYTQICVKVQGAEELNCFGQEYEDLVDSVVAKIEEIADERCEIRYAQVQEEGQQEIADAEDKITEALKELEDAAQELEDGREQIAEALQEIADGRAEIADGEAELAEAEQEYLDARQEVADGWEQADQGRQDIISAELQLAQGLEQYEAAAAQIEAGYEALASYEAQYEQLEELEIQLEAGIAQIEAKLSDIETTQEQKAVLEAQLTELQTQLAACQAGIAQLGPVIEETRAQLDAGAEELAASKEQLDAAQALIEESNGQIGKAVEQLAEAEQELSEAEQEIADGRQELEKARQELSEAEQEIADAQAELEEGEADYEKAKAEADAEIADAQAELEEARQELADLEVPTWYVLDRQYIASFVDYGQNAERIGAIGEVFPVIFFLVAALVCLTTMTRMVEEERTQIGTLKALGYGRGSIAAKYILYALISSLLGSLIGLVVGQKLLPAVIITTYKILYADLPYILTPLSLKYSVMASGAAVFCTTLATWAACYKELFAVPAELMRPAAPKAGKRVFLEKINIIWKRLNFSRKASVRNLIRYKKRFFMTIFGIGGCTALLLVGFGLKDSVSYIGTGQFENVSAYDAAVGIDTSAKEEEKEELSSTLSEDERIVSYMEALETALDVEKDGVQKSAYLVVPWDSSGLGDYIRLQDRVTGEEYELSKDGIIISEKLAKLLGVSEGDAVTLSEDDSSRMEAVVAHITENYFMHYVYMSKELYEELFQKEPECNLIFVCTAQTDEAFEAQLQEDYMELEAVSGVSFTTGMVETVDEILDTMNVVILVLVISAGMLAFIVLYNLNNINISERKRELATLKVLGFFDNEVSAYVNRENILLTVIGTAVGILFGILLHQFVSQTAETDTLMFGRTIDGPSFLYSVLLTFVFSFIVNGVLFFKLKKIDMVESLKSVE